MKKIITEQEKEKVCKVLKAAFVAKCGGMDFLERSLEFSKKQVAWYSGLTAHRVENILQDMVRNDVIEFHSHQGTSAKSSYTTFCFTENFPFHRYSTKELTKLIKKDSYGHSLMRQLKKKKES